MWKKLLMVCIFWGMQVMHLFSQSMKIGEKLNGLPDSIRGNKITIVEFWSIHCMACIRGFPELQRLRDKFKDDLNIVLVNKESYKQVDLLFARHKNLVRPSLPIISGDTLLTMPFKGLGYPFEVWLDSKGIIVAVTESGELNEDHVYDYLAGGKVEIKAASKRKLSSSLVESGIAAYGANVHMYSVLTDCSEKVSVGNHRGTAYGQGKVRLSEDCRQLVDLYKVAYSENGKYKFNQPFTIKFEISKAELLKRRYNYDLVVPSDRAGGLFSIMQQDLQQYFGYKAIVSKMYCKEVELLAKPGFNLLVTKGGEAITDTVVEDDYLTIRLSNKPFTALIEILGKHMLKLPMLLADRSFYAEGANVDISIRLDLRSDKFIESLRKELERYNLRIFLHLIPMDVLTVTDE